MGKKKKEKEVEASIGDPDVDHSAEPDVFKTLFGDVTEQNSFSSIFSDKNPFKRKHNELGPDSPQNVDSPKIEVKKRKASGDLVDGATDPSEMRKSEKEKRKDANSAGSLSKKLSKKLKEGDAYVDSDSNAALEVEKAKPSQSGLQSDGAINIDEQGGRNVDSAKEKSNDKDKKRKKRKRDELERAYEMTKYGPSVEEEVKDGEGENVTGKKRKKTDNPADLLVTKEDGFDDEDKLLRTVFVGNLPLKMKKKALLKEISRFGEVESVRIRSVPILDVSLDKFSYC